MRREEADVLLVAVCDGPRCRALRRLHDPAGQCARAGGQLLRDAVRERPDSVLISTACLGPCDRACVVAVGRGRTVDTTADGSPRLSWVTRPVGLGLVELPERAAELAGWVQDSAPDLTTLPRPLWGIGA